MSSRPRADIIPLRHIPGGASDMIGCLCFGNVRKAAIRLREMGIVSWVSITYNVVVTH